MQDKILESYIRSLLSERGGWGSEVDMAIAALGNETNLRKIHGIAKEIGLGYLGAGEFRYVYAIDDDWVLKIAKMSGNNPRHANRVESDPRLQSLLYPYVPQTIASGRYFGWIITEQCRTEYDFFRWLTKVGISKELAQASEYIRLSGLIELLNDHPDVYIDDANNQFIRKVIIADQAIGINFEDVRRGNVGYGYDKRPVILDLGLDKDWKKHNL